MSETMSLGKWAEKWDVSAAKLKKAVTELDIAPDHKKGNCAYYSEEDMKKALEKVKSK